MKEKNLQMRRNACLSLLFLLFMTMMSNNTYAQDQVATLQHNGEISTFYGANAFVEAHAAADTGDMITLSAGNFNTCDIYKLITIHGAGARQDTTVNDWTKTVFVTNFAFRCGGTETEHLTIEGVYFPAQVATVNLYYAEFYRCNIPFITAPVSWYGHDVCGEMSNCKFINCRIGTISYGYGNSISGWYWVTTSCNACFINSIVYNTYGLGKTLDTEKNIVAYNSYIAYGEENIQCSSFYNCVISGRSGYVPQETCTFNNCVTAKNSYEGSLLENAFNSNCMEVDTISQVFENFTGDFDGELFILKGEIANSIQGTDGTEVCIYGGISPYYDRPRYMTIRRCTVGGRTTDDGHLSVDIEVVTEQ